MRTFIYSLIVFSFACFSVSVSATAKPAAPKPTPPAEEPSAPGIVPSNNPGVFVDLSAGYAVVHWVNFRQGSFDGYSTVTGSGLTGSVNSNGRGGFAFGFDVGYQVNRFIGVEAGWYRLPTVKGNSDVFFNLPSLKAESWFAYLALKMLVPFSSRFSLIGKAGAGYRRLNYSGNATSVMGFGDQHPNYVSAVLGIGLQYWFDENWSITAQDLAMLKRTEGAVSKRAPTANLILGSVGYQFGVL